MTGPSRTTPHRRTTWIAAALMTASLALTGCSPESGGAVASTSAVTEVATTAADSGTDATTSSATITDTAAAAEEFLATLSDDQRETVLYDYDDETKTTSWSNFPVTFVDRAGLNLSELTEEQQTAALGVLQNLLSDEAYDTVAGIMGGDGYLLENSDSTEDSRPFRF